MQAPPFTQTLAPAAQEGSSASQVLATGQGLSSHGRRGMEARGWQAQLLRGAPQLTVGLVFVVF